jgi:class 3 adenylate cyclase
VALGDRKWKDALEMHDRAVRQQLDVFRGREIKTMGDGFLATFDGPARAIHCGRAIRDAAAEFGMSERVGLHSGEVEMRGDDIGGVAVHIGQRVSALAQPAQILVSSTVKDLVAGSGIEFEDRGEHELKGVPDRWHLYAVRS